MSREIAAQVVKAVDALIAFVDQHAEFPGGQHHTLTVENIATLIALDAEVEGSRIQVTGLRLQGAPPSVDQTRCIGYTKLNRIYRRSEGKIAIRPSQEWRERLESLRLAASVVARGSGDTPKEPQQRMPDNPDVRDLCQLLEKNRNRIAKGEKSEIGVARELTRNDDNKAKNLLRQARRFPHLWKRADK